MSFTPNRSDFGTIEPVRLFQESFSQASPIYLPLVVISTPAIVISVLDLLAPSIPLNLIYFFLVDPLVAGTGIFLVHRYLTTQTVDLDGSVSNTFAKIGTLIRSYFIASIIVIVSNFAVIFVGVKLWFVLYGVVIDDLNPIASLKQSWNLVGGRWWPTFGALLLPVILMILPIFLLAGIPGALLGESEGNDLSSIISSSLMVLIGPFLITYYTKIYLRLKELAE